MPHLPPSDDLMDREQRLWDAIQELRASTCSQDCPAKAPQPNPQVLALMAQVAKLQQEVAALHKVMAIAASPIGVINEDGCCPGLSGAPHIHRARELIALANEVDHLKSEHSELDKDIQEMSEVIDLVNDRFSPCLSVGPSLNSQLAELSMVVTAQGLCLDITEQQTTLANNKGAHISETLTTLKKSVLQPWARQGNSTHVNTLLTWSLLTQNFKSPMLFSSCTSLILFLKVFRGANPENTAKLWPF
ncbi:hypothetical protein DSO57_1006381 [Entomophthora muscae]|uniref:Uncharacterized protein n=1 Tax=Entomophthora muscae TaxID=34485 RepID=A0ACC2SWT4_9FUNG|nr:hypothetical protein DSO57_1006381 [Entomophthora muscae]